MRHDKTGLFITSLRKRCGYTQKDVAEKLGVSDKAVSRWETGKGLPDTSLLKPLSEIFSVTVSELLAGQFINGREELEMFGTQDTASDIFPWLSKTIAHDRRPDGADNASAPRFEGKYFGTDGFRGKANVGVTAEDAYKIGRFLGWYFASPLSGCKENGYRPRIVLGKDTRRSSYMFEYAIAAGLSASGADVYMLHVTTTPSVSFVTHMEAFDCGIMISASHNPYYDNGIKLINKYGEKMNTRHLAYLEAYLDGDLETLGLTEDIPLASDERVGAIIDHASGRNRYIAYLISLAAYSYKGMRIGLDCANGASWMIAPSVFGALGATTYVINASPDGKNINKDAGSTHIDRLREHVLSNHLDVGFAFDGDADRCIAVDEKGNEINGDKLLYVLARRLHSRGVLANDLVVTTVMTNSGLTKSLEQIGIDCVESAVGDQNVYDLMCKRDSMLGGEQSGHIIIRKYATTGDGILTAIMILEEMMERKQPLSVLTEKVIVYPQILKNLKVYDKSAVASDKEIDDLVAELNNEFGNDGRIFVRPSGTEPLIRIMAEGDDMAMCRSAIEKTADLITRKGYVCES